MKKYLLGLLVLCMAGTAFGLEVVYPKKKYYQINSPSTFFIGSSDADKELFINGEPVVVHKTGGFAKPVDLKFGLNVFEIVSGEDKLTYNITRPEAPLKPSTVKAFQKYEDIKNVIVTLNKAPLRSTPIDSGINRLSHLPSDMSLNIDGEENEFYRVVLGENLYGWIMKDHVKFTDNPPVNDIVLKDYTCKVDNEFYECKFNLSDRVAWEIIEGETLNLKLFNVSNHKGGVFSFKFPLKKLIATKNLIGYSTSYEDNTFVLKIRRPLEIYPEKPLLGVKIMIDAGHGGDESGAIGCLGHLEKDINLTYAKALKKELSERGAEVFMTRKSDKAVGLSERVQLTNDSDSSIFISLHGNALPDSRNPIDNFGTEIYYYYPQARPLAQKIMNSLTTDKDFINHGIIQQSFAVVRNTEALSILIEIGYLINPEDNAKILDNEFRQKFVRLVADGLEEYLTSQK